MLLVFFVRLSFVCAVHVRVALRALFSHRVLIERSRGCWAGRAGGQKKSSPVDSLDSARRADRVKPGATHC